MSEPKFEPTAENVDALYDLVGQVRQMVDRDEIVTYLEFLARSVDCLKADREAEAIHEQAREDYLDAVTAGLRDV